VSQGLLLGLQCTNLNPIVEEVVEEHNRMHEDIDTCFHRLWRHRPDEAEKIASAYLLAAQKSLSNEYLSRNDSGNYLLVPF